MKKLICFLTTLVICLFAAVNVSAEKNYPINAMITSFDSELIVSWVNPDNLLKTELYSVEDYTDTLITDEFSITAGETVEYSITGLTNGQYYLYRIKFYYTTGEVYSLLLSERPVSSSINGLKMLGKWVVQPRKTPFKMNIDQTTGYDDNSSIHISVNHEASASGGDPLFLRYDASIPAGTYVVRARIKYDNASKAKAYINGIGIETNGTSDGWTLLEKQFTLSEAKNPVFHVFIYSTTKDYWIDDFEIHKITNGVEDEENLAQNSDAEELLSRNSEITVPEVSVQNLNASARVMWNMYGLEGCKINIYNKKTGVLAASVNSRFNSVILRDLLNGEAYSYIVKTENTMTRESETSAEISFIPQGGGVTLSSEFVNHSVNVLQYSNGYLLLSGKLLNEEENKFVTLTAYRNGTIAAIEQTETKENGIFEFYFPLEKGEYTLNISSLDYEKESAVLTIVFFNDTIEEIDKMRDELATLISECENKGIPTDYEKIAWRIIERDSVYFREDVKYGQNIEWDKRYEALCNLHEQARDSLKKYLSGEKTPQSTVRYVTGEAGMMENNFYGQTTAGEKPVYYMGYSTSSDNIQYMTDLGFNYAATSIEPTDVVTYGAAPYWVTETKNENIYLDNAGLVINGEMRTSQFVCVNAGETYTFGAEVSGEGEYEIALAGNKSGVYTAEKDAIVELVISNLSGENVFKNTYVNNNGVNILKNPDFKMQDELFDKYNFTASMEKIFVIKNVLQKAAEDGVAVCLNMSLHRVPDVVKEDAETTSSGAVAINPTHPRYLNSCEVFLKALLEECGNSAALHDVILYNEPTFYANKSGYYNDAWQKFLYDKKGITETTAMPSDDDKANTLYTLYMKFNDSIMTEFHKTAAEFTRKYCDNPLIHTKLMQYIRPYHGSAVTKYSNDYESWAQYFDVNGCDAFSMYFDKDFVPLSAEEAWYDYMRSVKKTPVINSEDHIIHDVGENELITFSDMEKKYVSATMWQGAFHGRGASAVWTYKRSPYYLYFDEGQSVYINSNMTLRPDLQYELGKISLDMNRLSEEIALFQNKKKQAAILFSPISMNYAPVGMSLITEAYNSLLFMGEGVEFVAEGRMDDLNKYKMLIIPNANYVSDETYQKIADYAKNGGQLYLIGDCLGYDEDGVSREKKLTGTNVNSVDLIWGSLNAISKTRLKTIMRTAINNIFERKLTVTNTNGTNSDDIEYSYAEDSIYSYVNLCNHSGEEKSIKVLYDSEILSASTDLISGRNFDSGSLKLAPYETLLLRTENRKISAKIEKDAQSQTNVYKATFDVKRSTSNEEVLLIFASYEANGQLSEVKTVKADFSAQSDKSYTISLGIKSEERLKCMAVNAATLVPYIDLLELKPELN